MSSKQACDGVAILFGDVLSHKTVALNTELQAVAIRVVPTIQILYVSYISQPSFFMVLDYSAHN